jgi:hypothetical protein
MCNELNHPGPESWEFKTLSQSLAVEVVESAVRRGFSADWGRIESEGKFVATVWECGRDAFSAILGEATRAVSALQMAA